MGVKRVVDAEQYFTHPELARRCVQFMDEHLSLDQYSLFVEPSAGEGSFLDLLPSERRIGVDIHPRSPEVQQADFLTWQPPRVQGRIAVIGNPPFGQRAALAIDFLEHACSFADAVAFILPRSFNKYTFQNRVPEYFHLAGSFNCEEFYLEHGASHTVKTVFQVWERQTVRRQQISLSSSHPHFEMKHAHLSRVTPETLSELRANYTFAIPQVGARFKPKDVDAVTKGSYWFIRPLVEGVRERFEMLDFDFLAEMNTAHMSLSKRDIVAAYAVVLETSTEGTSAVLDLAGVEESQLSLWAG